MDNLENTYSLLEQRANYAEAEVVRLEGELVARSSDRSAAEHAVWRQELEALLRLVDVSPGPPDQELDFLRRQNRESQATIALLKMELTAEAQQAARLASENAKLRLELSAARRRTPQSRGSASLDDGPPPNLAPDPLAVLKAGLEAMKEREAESLKARAEEATRQEVAAEPELPPPPADAHRELQRQAFEDPISGLPKFQLGYGYLVQELQRAARGLGSVALTVVDIDQIRSINIHLGRDMGDLILRELPVRLMNCLKPEDVLVRGQDDEFWIITPLPTKGPLGIKNVTHRASTALNHFLELLKTPFVTEEHKLRVTVGCGLAVGQGKEDADQMIERASLALKAAKAQGRNRAALYQPEMDKLKKKGKVLLPILRQALQADQFCLRFQPIYDLKSQQVKGVESLIRWNHPVRGLLDPSHFQEEARETGFVIPLGDWALKEHCLIAKGFGSGLFASLSVSAQELMQADFVRKLTKAIEGAKISRPDGLVIEVSESFLVGENERLYAALGELKRWNVQLAIDDFSFDTLSVGRLKKLNVNYLKISPRLVANIDSQLGRNLIDTALIAAENLGCKTIAEGIETPGQLEMLLELGCPLGQGDQLCPPVPPGNLVEKATFRRAEPPTKPPGKR